MTSSISGPLPPPVQRRRDIKRFKVGHVNRRRNRIKAAVQKAISIILRREATKAVIEKKKGNNTKKLLPRTVLEALHDCITALRWDSALKSFEKAMRRKKKCIM